MASLQIFAAHAILPLFVLLNVGMVVWAYVKTPGSTFEDYVGGGRTVSKKMLTMTLFAVLASGLELNGFNFVLRYGVLQIIRTACMIIGVFFVATLMLPILSKSNKHVTIGDVMGSAYGSVAQIITGLFVLVLSYLVFYRNVNIIFLMSEYLLETNDEEFPHTLLVIALFVGVALVYMLLGGARSMHYTHLIQMTAGLVALLALAFILFRMAGGAEGLWEYLPEDRLLLSSHPEFSRFLRVNVFRIPFFMFMVIVPMFPRVAKLEDKSEVKKVGLFSAVLYAIVALLIFFVGLSGLSLNEELGIYGDSVHFFMLLRSLFGHVIVLRLLFVGFLGIMLSSIDAYLHVAAVSAMHDIVAPIMRWLGKDDLIDKYQLLLTRIFLFVLCSLFFAFIFLLNFSFGEYTYWFLALTSTAMLGGLVAAMLDE